MSLSVIIPTIGRESLQRVLEQVCPQLQDDDEVVVVADGPVPRAAEIAASFPVRYFEHGPTHVWGNAQRNFGIKMARGTHLYFLDDDDQSLPGALQTIREKVADEPKRIHLFRMHHGGGILWARPEVCMGNVSTQMIVVPNDSFVAQWPDVYAGDLMFLFYCLEKRGNNDVCWHEEIIAIHGISTVF